MNNVILSLFGKAIKTDNTLSFKYVNELSTKLGYLVHPDVCNQEVYDWLTSQNINYNSTFYKKWSDVTSKNRFELYIDQIRHYVSTYGTDYQGEVFLPEGNIEVPPFTEFKIIYSITEQELISKCENILFSGIALKQDTIDSLITTIKQIPNYSIDIDKIKNKEAKMFLYKETNTLPAEPVEMVRYLVYLATDNTLLIKDEDTINKIRGLKYQGKYIDLHKYVDAFGYSRLSSVFLRFKPILLAFKKGSASNAKCVNKLRKIAIKNHTAMKQGYFETLLSCNNPDTLIQLEDRLDSITNFKKIALLQTINTRLKEIDNRFFLIRNQKMFVKQDSKTQNNQHLRLIHSVIYKHLVKSLSKKSCKVTLPIGVNLTLPTSEKSFIGNYPLGTSFNFANTDSIFGIHWREKDGAKDLDLKLIDIDGKQYGWNAAYTNTNNSIIYSGDMTSANPEATELFYTTGTFKPAIVKVNLFNGDINSKFRFFLAKEKITDLHKNYMVDPNNILAVVDCEMDSKEKTLGVITQDKFILAQFRTGKGRVAGESVTNLYTDYALKTLDSYLDLITVLADAGFTFVDHGADIDLMNLSRDTLIDILK